MQGKKENIVRVEFDPANPPPLTEEQKARMEALARMPDSEIDYSDIPPVTDFSGWRRFEDKRSIRLDADILEWLCSRGHNFEAQANAILRREMLAARQSAAP